jgi:hypothetical protein
LFYLTKRIGKSGQLGSSAVDQSILGQSPGKESCARRSEIIVFAPQNSVRIPYATFSQRGEGVNAEFCAAMSVNDV